MYIQDWHILAEQLIDKQGVTRMVHRYLNETTGEEEFGKGCLNELQRTYPEHADRINRLLVIPGIGAYITHWLLEQAGALCR